MLKFEDGTLFVNARCGYRYQPIRERDPSHRIILQIQIEGIDIEAVLDTGAVYLVTSPEIAPLLALDPSGAVGEATVKITGREVRGKLFRRVVQLLADEGRNLAFEATLLVPDDDPSLIWDLPAFLGLQGCLERIRFAVDPKNEQFYFGPIDWESI